MSLFERASIFNMYIINLKKSIRMPERKDLVLILAVLVLGLTPLVVNFFSGLDMRGRAGQKELFLSPVFKELFGAQITETLISEFEEQNPDIKIRLFNPAENQTRANSSRRSRAAEPVTLEPDILVFDDGGFSNYIEENTLLQLNPYTDSDYAVFAIPLVSFMDLLFYNIPMLQAAGFDRPPKTRDDFFAYARAVSGGTTGILESAFGSAMGLSAKDKHAVSREIYSWILASGGNFRPGADVSANTRQIVADFTFLGRLYREGTLSPDAFNATGQQRLDEFAQGKTAMIIASTRAIPELRKKMGDDTFGITTVPVTASPGKYGICISSLYAGINTESPHPDEAWGFIEFIYKKSPVLCAWLEAVPGVVSDVIPGDYVRDDPFYSKARDIFYSGEITYGFSGKSGRREYETIILEELWAFFETNRTAQDTVNTIQRRWNEVFDNQDSEIPL